jgi:hypothetical protein
LIQAAFDRCAFLDGTAPNALTANLDVNGKQLINVADGVNPQDVATVNQVGTAVASSTAAAASSAAALVSENNASISAAAALVSETNAATSAAAVSQVIGNLAVTVTGGTRVLTTVEAGNNSYDILGVLTSNQIIELPQGNAFARDYIVDNSTTGAFTLQVRTTGGVNLIAVPQGSKYIMYSNGTEMEGVTAVGGGGTVTSIYGRIGDVLALPGDYTKSDIGLGNVRNVNQVERTSATGSSIISVGTTAQRDGTPALGYQRWNTTDGSMEVWDGTSWSPLGGGGGATGGGADQVFYENDQVVTTNYTLTAGKNAMSAGPITINTGVIVTVPTGAKWTIA